MPDNYLFKDQTGDKKYFTIVPNIIVNGYGAMESGVYLYLKRKAGETGTFYGGLKKTAKELDIHYQTLAKILKKFEKDGRIKFIGWKPFKTHPTKEYAITDIWKENVINYKKKGYLNHPISTNKKRKDDLDVLRKDDLKHPKNNLLRRRTNKKKNIIKRKGKYSSIKNILEEDLIEIAQKYRVPLAFVKLQLEALRNYCQSKGRRYKNYKAALRNFVINDAKRQIERRQGDNKRGIDARQIE